MGTDFLRPSADGGKRETCGWEGSESPVSSYSRSSRFNFNDTHQGEATTVTGSPQLAMIEHSIYIRHYSKLLMCLLTQCPPQSYKVSIIPNVKKQRSVS